MKVAVLAGTGNNGGDGIAAGRILNETGYEVMIILVGNESKLTLECQTQLDIADNLDIEIIYMNDDASKDDKNDVIKLIDECDLIIDAIFGIGLSRNITGLYAEYIEAVNASEAIVFAVDIASGVDSSDGKILGIAVKADYTVTFGVPKIGHILFPGALYSGEVITADIGFPKKVVEKVSPEAFTYTPEDIQKLFPKRIPRSNKGTYGKVLIVAGSENIGGAALFSAQAAYMMGAGLVKVITHKNNRHLIQNALPEALLEVYSDESTVTDILQKDIEWASCIVAGPGLGTDETAVNIVETILAVKDKPLVLDADAVNILAEMDIAEEYMENVILTPHLKELSRLIDTPVNEIADNLIGVTEIIKRENMPVYVIKDARTLVYNGKNKFINTSGNNALAKGGSGDVLSGIIGGLLALGMKPFDAASLGVYIHGLTAEKYSDNSSQSTMLARDIIEMLKVVLP